MFTGLIREVAIVDSMINNFLTIRSKYNPNIGDSIAINGACLTVVKKINNGFTVELSPETQKTISMNNISNLVHMEPAMKLSDRLEGHIVQGHIDTIGKITKLQKNNNSYELYISLDRNFIKYIIPKGSITIDGVSLTVNDVYDDKFRLTIIPHTMENTLFHTYQIGREVNIETDMFARYLFHMFKKDNKLDWNTVDTIMASY